MRISSIKLRKITNKKFVTSTIIKLFMYALLLDLVFVFLFPFLYMIVTSMKSPIDLTDISIKWIINEVHFENYKLAFEVLDYPRRFMNT